MIPNVFPPKFLLNSPPTFNRIAAWLELDGPVEAHQVVSETPILESFIKHYPNRRTIATNPEALERVIPVFFAYSNDQMLTSQGTSFDRSATAFASEVVKYLEESSDAVAWKPLVNKHESFDVVQYRWAVALQIYWLLAISSGGNVGVSALKELLESCKESSFLVLN
ncbi:hypothetical protein F5Y09DRAFT_357430 [Xylaria sp. FL1042]|nr:hypothetical protein F5Y09DRAFT_357430 [Xylaria sp. FL1042]